MTHGQGLGLRGAVADDFRMQLRRSRTTPTPIFLLLIAEGFMTRKTHISTWWLSN